MLFQKPSQWSLNCDCAVLSQNNDNKKNGVVNYVKNIVSAEWQ